MLAPCGKAMYPDATVWYSLGIALRRAGKGFTVWHVRCRNDGVLSVFLGVRRAYARWHRVFIAARLESMAHSPIPTA
jgi:hypothetical protein